MSQTDPPKFPINKILIVAAVAVLLIGASYLLQSKFFPDGLLPETDQLKDRMVATVSTITDVQINEVMSSNQNAYEDDRGKYPDWIELTNVGKDPISLEGWTLVDKIDDPNPFHFPAYVLQPGEYVVVFASGKLQNNLRATFHAPFKLSASGDSLLLFDRYGLAVETLNLPPLQANQVYSRDVEDGGWSISSQYTPGMANTAENFEKLKSVASVSDSKLVLSEIMASNASYVPDEQGGYYDWIELYNSGEEAINLKGYSLSDMESKPGKWSFPERMLAPGEYIVVYASGKDIADEEGSLHTNFKLKAEGETVYLSDSAGGLISRASYDNLQADRSYALQSDGSWRQTVSPTPGQPNTREGAVVIQDQLLARNPSGVLLNEVVASVTNAKTGRTGSDWLELYNTSNQPVDLQGFGLSDDPNRPRKWQFPEGATVGAGEYLTVALTGNGRSGVSSNALETNFKLSVLGGEILTLCTPEGKILDRVPMEEQHNNVSFGRIEGQRGFFYLPQPTKGAQNSVTGYTHRLNPVVFSVAGGLYNQPFELAISSPEGAEIRYTIDCTEPTRESILYQDPVQIVQTVVVRAKAFSQDGLESKTITASYFFGIEHSLPVVSLVADPVDLWSDKRGIYAKGPNATAKFPFGSINKGANFWMRWEREGSIEIWNTQKELLVSDNIGLGLHGQYSRAEEQKSFSISARPRYNRTGLLRAGLFPNRTYKTYQSVLLRSTGQDSDRARMRDAVLTSLAEDTGLMYQDVQPAVLYLNGQYWGHYNLRERINKHAVARYMGWKDPDNVDLVKGNNIVLNGSNDSYAELIAYLKENGCQTEEGLQYVEQRVDIDNFLDYEIIQIFVGNGDAGNLKRYRNAVDGDGKWRWILYDLDWAFTVLDTNSIARYLDPEGVGTNKIFDTTLFVELMKNSAIRERFLARFGERLARDFSTESIIQKIDAMVQTLEPEMPGHYEKWPSSVKSWRKHVDTLRDYAKKRPEYIINYTIDTLDMTEEEVQRYFGRALDALQ